MTELYGHESGFVEIPSKILIRISRGGKCAQRNLHEYISGDDAIKLQFMKSIRELLICGDIN